MMVDHRNMLLRASVVLLLNYFTSCYCTTSRIVPDFLIDCYRDGGTIINAPRNVQLLVELISKIELANENHNVRTLSSSLLHSLRLDGIERSPNVQESEFVTPYRASAFQFSKFSFLLDMLLPGGASGESILSSLSQLELCTLHMLLSASVDPWERGDEHRTCPMSMEGGHSGDVGPHLKKNLRNITKSRPESARSRCPLENGVVQSTWGDVAAGTLMAAISAALEPQSVRVSDLVLEVTERGEGPEFQDDDIIPLRPDPVGRRNYDGALKKSLLGSEKTISSVLAATLAGDLAELIIRQGPLAGMDPAAYQLGPGGRWNDSVLPRKLYLMQPNPGLWEFTDAEMLAGIDGLIIASHVGEWADSLRRIRLSQVLESYYSSYGVAFDHDVRACNRMQNLRKLLDMEQLREQTLSLVSVLWFTLGDVFVPEATMKTMTYAAVEAFKEYWPKLVESQPSCDVKGDTNAMDVILTTDGTWTKYQSEQLMSILSETLDVSGHGSSLGFLHGGNADWMATPSHSILEIFDDIANQTIPWPNRLNLPAVLTSVITHLENLTISESSKPLVAGLPRVVILAAPTTTLSSSDLAAARTIMLSLRKSYTDLYFLYLMPDEQGFNQLAVDQRKYADMLIKSSETDIKTVAELIRLNFIEKIIPKRLIPLPCEETRDSSARHQYEDYINVGQKILFMIHPNYLVNIPVVTVQFQGTEQGEISVCVSRKYTEDAAVSCKMVSGQYDANLVVRHPCNLGTPTCDPVYFIVRARNTMVKCADKDCRYPDQIRFIIRHSGLECAGNNRTSSANRMTRGDTNYHVTLFGIILQTLLILLFK